MIQGLKKCGLYFSDILGRVLIDRNELMGEDRVAFVRN